jgi:hypothetical protein
MKIKVLDLEEINKEEALRLVTTERNYRYSDKYQQMYITNIQNDRRKNVDAGGIIVEDIIQLDVLKDCGYEPNSYNLDKLRRMFNMFREDKDIRNVAFWIGMNIVHDGVKLGTPMKNSAIYSLDGLSTDLDTIVNKRTIVMAGSIT